MAMKCPRTCDTLLVAETLAGIEVDRCPTCDGVWLDLGEGEIVTRPGEVEIPAEVRAEMAALDEAEKVEDTSDPLDCPRCELQMGRERYSGSGVIIDRCGCGVWLDKGELERIAAYRATILQDMRADPAKGGYPPDLYERAFSRFYFDLGTPPVE